MPAEEGQGEDEQEARVAQVIKAPSAPTRQEIEEHEVTHLPPRTWCHHCVEGRGIAAPHHDHEEEEGRLPTLGTDFFHMGQSDEPVLPMIAAKEKATKMLFAHMLPSKEVGQHVVDVTKDDIEFLGLKRFVYKSDGEPAIKAVKTAVTESLPTTSTVMPEESPVEDHQANGDIENAIREIGKEIRTLKSSTESKIGRRIASNHPILAWLPAHAAFLISRYAVGADGKTAYERSRGKKYKRELVPFAERIHFIVPGPKRHMNKLESKWSTGRFVGCVQRTNEMLVMTDRGVVKARSVKRMTEQERWKTDDWDQIVGTPWEPKPAEEAAQALPMVAIAQGEAGPPPPPLELPGEQPGRARRVYIRREVELQRYGPTQGCDGCEAATAGRGPRAHSEICRRRIEQAMKDDQDDLGRMRIAMADARRDQEDGGAEDRRGGAPRPKRPRHEALADAPGPVGSAVAAAPGAASSQEASGPAPMEDGEARKRAAEVPVDQLDPEAAAAAAGSAASSMSASSGANLSALHREVLGHFQSEGWEVEQDTADSIVNKLYGLGRSRHEAGASLQVATTSNGLPPPVASGVLNSLYGEKSCNDVSEIYSPPRIAAQACTVGLRPGFSIDLVTRKRNGDFWDLSKPEDAREAEALRAEEKPYFLCGGPPCDPFSRLQALNAHKRTEEQNEAIMERGRLHLSNAVRMYRAQLRDGHHFLHEHPDGATSWREKDIEDLAAEPGVYRVRGPMCRWEMTSEDAQGVGLVKKETGWLTSSAELARILSGVCSNAAGGRPWHRHVQLINGRASAARAYPPKLVDAILEGIRAQMVLDGELSSITAYPAPEEPLIKTDTTEETEEYEQYLDDVNGGLLIPSKVRAARSEELEEVAKHEVYTRRTLKECYEVTGRPPIQLRWVDTNKGDDSSPEYRSRLVVKELKKRNTTLSPHELYASTPPLEMIKMLLSLAMTLKRSRRGKPLKLSFIDIRRAHFHSAVKRQIYVTLPDEQYEEGYCGLLSKSMYGTQDAPACWEAEYTDMYKNGGYGVGVANASLFYNEEEDSRSVVHGDDFVTLADDDGQAHLFKLLDARYEYKKRAMLGPEACDDKEIKILNRYIQWRTDTSPPRIEYEADARHAELIARSLSLEGAKSVGTPMVKKKATDYEVVSPKLGTEGATLYRSLTMRAAYLGQDRADIQVAVKELARNMKEPTEQNMGDLKRLARYLKLRPRVVQYFEEQSYTNQLTIYVDSDHAGCLRTRKSTTGLVVQYGSHTLRTQSVTQSNIALSSGESEFGALVKGSAVGIGLQSMAADLGIKVKNLRVRVGSDSSAARAIASRRGLGPTRHIATRFLWVQEKVKDKILEIFKAGTAENTSDMLTKALDHARINELMASIGQFFVSGRFSGSVQLHGDRTTQ